MLLLPASKSHQRSSAKSKEIFLCILWYWLEFCLWWQFYKHFPISSTFIINDSCLLFRPAGSITNFIALIAARFSSYSYLLAKQSYLSWTQPEPTHLGSAHFSSLSLLSQASLKVVLVHCSVLQNFICSKLSNQWHWIHTNLISKMQREFHLHIRIELIDAWLDLHQLDSVLFGQAWLAHHC